MPRIKIQIYVWRIEFQTIVLYLLVEIYIKIQIYVTDRVPKIIESTPGAITLELIYIIYYISFYQMWRIEFQNHRIYLFIQICM